MSGAFGPVQPTPYDLRFRLFSIPVNVLPWFWVASLVSGWHPSAAEHLDLLAIWVACFFVSILVHEMGHALIALSFGWPPEVFLYQFGGLAVYRPTRGHSTGRSVLISLAGPGAGFVLYGLVYLLQKLVLSSTCFWTLGHASQFRLLDFFVQMEWINLWWGLVNLLPVLPLDGGRIAEAILQRIRPWDGPALAVKLSIVVAGGVALFFFSRQREYGLFPALLFGLLAISNFQSLQQRRSW